MLLIILIILLELNDEIYSQTTGSQKYFDNVRWFGGLPRVAYLKRLGIHFEKFELNSKREQSGHD